MKKLSPAQRKRFKRRVYTYYRTHGRHHLPWRATTNPYHILVSEVMLQQTQVERVIPKYRAFLKRFPTVRSLASAPLSDVVQAWSGLGYNRRAKMLHDAANHIVAEYKGRFPQTVEALEALPGVGPYTARAVVAFAYNKPVVMIETNIRTVFLHEFFRTRRSVPDADITPLIAQCLAEEEPHEWYAALMDYGAYLKHAHPNPSSRSKHHVVQPAFRGSLREARGGILRALCTGSKTERALVEETGYHTARVQQALSGLMRDGLVVKRRRTWALAT